MRGWPVLAHCPVALSYSWESTVATKGSSGCSDVCADRYNVRIPTSPFGASIVHLVLSHSHLSSDVRSYHAFLITLILMHARRAVCMQQYINSLQSGKNCTTRPFNLQLSPQYHASPIPMLASYHETCRQKELCWVQKSTLSSHTVVIPHDR